jgi:GNAT superfamily N-acetyltransferase
MSIAALFSNPAIPGSALSALPGSPLYGAELTLIRTQADDPAAVPLIAGLLGELTARTGSGAVGDFDQAHRREFASWLGGDLVLLDEDDTTVGGGAYRRYDSTTVQLDWLWTRPDRRRLGFARRIVAELERSAATAGYERVYAVAGPGQAEARRLLATGGYTPVLSTATAVPDYLGFVKSVGS